MAPDVAAGHAEPRARPRLRGWVLAVGLFVLVVLITFGWWGWNRWLPGYQPELKSDERYGVDVSSHQGEINWDRVAGDEMAFAYIKASEGGDFVDERFGDNWADAGAAGLDRGAYHFFTLCRPGEDQADNEGEYHLRDGLERPVWHRRILIRPDVEGWWIWQVHGYAVVDGIDGPADLNVMRGALPR